MKTLKPFTIEYDTIRECVYIFDHYKPNHPKYTDLEASTLVAVDTTEEAISWLLDNQYITQ